jgi:hypothetical protein
MANTARHFNRRQHITAGELRLLGFYLSELLAREAYVRRVAVGLDEREKLFDGTASLRLYVLEPFTAEELAEESEPSSA